MNQRTPAITFGTFAILAGLGWGAARHLGVVAAPAAEAGPVAFTGPDREQQNQEIASFQARVHRDPYSNLDLASLAGLLLQRGRETGNPEDFRRAEEAARRSLALGTGHNAGTYRILAASLLDQHRFVEALEAARALVEAEPEDPVYRALLGEVQLELGEYHAARVTFGSLESARQHLAVAPALARWHEITGDTRAARGLLYAARDQAAARLDLPRAQLAWFHFRVGDFELKHGRLGEAEAAFRAGLAIRPDDYRILAGMARLEALRGNWKRAIEYGDEAIAQVLDPATLGLMSDAYAALGDSARADEHARVMEISIQNQEGAFHRAWNLFLLDHNGRVAEISAQAAEELDTRRDVYGYDLLAWALHKQGRNAEAKAAMTRALRVGTKDAMLFYHAGMIERALGENEAAKGYLRRALEVNPHFHPTQPATARAVLDSIQGEEPWYRRLPLLSP